jgi:hypothetical protein
MFINLLMIIFYFENKFKGFNAKFSFANCRKHEKLTKEQTKPLIIKNLNESNESDSINKNLPFGFNNLSDHSNTIKENEIISRFLNNNLEFSLLNQDQICVSNKQNNSLLEEISTSSTQVETEINIEQTNKSNQTNLHDEDLRNKINSLQQTDNEKINNNLESTSIKILNSEPECNHGRKLTILFI